MKIQIKKVRRSAFTLIEMIGVLAVIAILAALLIPKIFEAINNARINNACISINTVKTALADHYAKYGSLASSSGTALTIPATGYPDFDKVLLTEAFIDKPFEVKVSNDADIMLQTGVAIGTAPDGANAAFDLDGDGVNDIGPLTIVEAVLKNVNAADAIEISKRLDGELMSTNNPAVKDIRGRVVYAAPASGVAEVHVYLTHR